MILRVLVQLDHGRARCGPDVDAAHKPYSQMIGLAPIHQIQIKVIAQLWSIQYFVRNFGNIPLLFVLEYLVTVVMVTETEERAWLKHVGEIQLSFNLVQVAQTRIQVIVLATQQRLQNITAAICIGLKTCFA